VILKVLRKKLYDIFDLLGSEKLTPKNVKQGFALYIVFFNAVNPKYQFWFRRLDWSCIYHLVYVNNNLYQLRI
jgi:hypothetical protein